MYGDSTRGLVVDTALFTGSTIIEQTNRNIHPTSSDVISQVGQSQCERLTIRSHLAIILLIALILDQLALEWRILGIFLPTDENFLNLSSKHIIIFVPGLMGTELRYVGEGPSKEYQNYPVWGEDLEVLLHCLAGDPNVLARELVPGKVISELRVLGGIRRPVYQPLLDFLVDEMKYVTGSTLFPFGYDWRKDLNSIANSLGRFIKQLKNWEDVSFIFIAHSMGSLAVRLLLSNASYIDIRDKTRRVIQVAPPTKGSSKACYTLKHIPEFNVFLDTIINLKSRLKPRLLLHLMEVLRGFDSLYQLLPPISEPILQQETGDRYSAMEERVWANQYHPKVRIAREVQQQFSESSFPSTLTIYGTELATPQDYLVDQDFKIIDKIPSPVKGDGTVSMSSATYACPSETRFPISNVTATHDSLPNHQDFFRCLRTELSRLT